MPFFSVVIPVYNRADLVGETLESVLSQEFDDWEIVVVDDGSSDDSLAVIESYRSRFGARLNLVAQPNLGNGAARNRGIAQARGRYVALLDSDDLWFSWTLGFYAALLEKHDYPAFLAGAPFLFDHDAGLQDEPQLTLDEALQSARVEAFGDYLASGTDWRWWGVSSWVLRRDALEDKAFFERHFNGEDHDFALQMGVEAGFLDVQKPATFAYRKHAGNATFSAVRSAGGMELLIANERAGLYPGGAKRAKERRAILSRHLRPGILEELQQGHRKRAWWIFKRTLGWHLQLGRARFLLGFVALSLRPLTRASRQSNGA